jgi:hypothetical protein
MGSFDFEDGSLHEPSSALDDTTVSRTTAWEGLPPKSGEPKLPQVKRTEAMFF